MQNDRNKATRPILVLGATGKTGSRVVQRLTNRNWPIRLGSRAANPPFDWLDQTTWQPALAGMKAVYITFQPDLAVPGAADVMQAFVDVAVNAGVEQLVLLSGRGEEAAQASEEVVQQAGVDWTILRASWFNQNFSEGYLLDPIREGVVALPIGAIGEPFIDADDIADVAVAALTEPGHATKIYELAGPRLLTFADAMSDIANATGRPIHYTSVSLDAYVSALTKAAVPADYIALLTYLFTEVLDGRNASLTDGVQQALGRPPADFTDYARKTAATGIWHRP